MYTRQVSTTLRRSTPTGSATLRVHQLGAHPILLHFLERMNVSEIIRSCVGAARETEVDHAQAVVVLLQNLVLSPGPLYRIGEWAEPVEPHVLGLTAEQKAAINLKFLRHILEEILSCNGECLNLGCTILTTKQCLG